MVKNLAIIPARSGSKRVPDKNIKDFMGKPLMAYTIEAAIESGIFDKVIVSTDSEEYAQIAKKYGAEVPFLRDKCSDDKSTLADVAVNVLDSFKNKFNLEYDNFSILQVSSPLRSSNIIAEVYEFFVKNNFNTLTTCSSFAFMNPWWSFKMKNNEADFLLSNPMQSRSQDNEELFCPNGAVSFANVKEFYKEPSFYGEGHKFYPIDWKYSVDIDTYEDIEFAKAVYIMLQNKLAQK